MPARRPGFIPPNAPLLYKKAVEVSGKEIAQPEVQHDIERMLALAYGEQTDRTKPVLVGLAAPQVGIGKRIILVAVGADGRGKVSDLRVYINPEIVLTSKEESEWYEGCYSTDRVCGIVSRPTSIRVMALTREGKAVKEEYSGYVARIFQHEVDHLDGKVFIDHIQDEDKLHFVEDHEFPLYRDNQAWRNWPRKCPRKRWEEIKRAAY